ncbi:Cytochrome P450 52A3 [Irineochytrium annulatum]|nr:Cytochrome P450 52A3 [Irineochytrium annulatum]
MRKMFREVVSKVVTTDVNQLIRKLGEAADAGSAVDLHLYFHSFTMDTFGKIGFGEDLRTLDTPNSPPAFATAFDSTLEVMTMRFINFAWYWSETLGFGPNLRKHVAVIDKFAQERIERRKDMRRRGVEGANKDLLDFFMDAKKEDGNPLSDRQLRDVILNMILAGRDTTAQALSWTFLELVRNPAVVTKLREEGERVLGSRRIPTFDEIAKLRYANAVFMENQRLHPSVPANVKVAVKEDILPGGIHIPANTEICWLPYAMGRHPNLWGADALEFKPERWLDKDGSVKRVSPYLACGFNAGPRVCLGQQMATVEGIMAMLGLVNEFDFETVQKDMPDPAAGLSLTHSMAGGLPMYVRRARSSAK